MRSYSAPEPEWISLSEAVVFWHEVADEIEKYAAIAVEQVRKSAHPPIRSRCGGVHNYIEAVRAEVFPHGVLV